MGFSSSSVAEIYCPIGNTVGSGYFCTSHLVLTARHVVSGSLPLGGLPDIVPGSETAEYLKALPQNRSACRVRSLDNRGGSFVDAIPIWWSDTSDVALLALIGLQPDIRVERISWADIEESEPIDVIAVGFPEADLEGRTRESRQISGHLNPLSRRKADGFAFHVHENIGKPPSSAVSSWAGMSGAALFAGGCLIGIVLVDPDPTRPERLELWALPVRKFANDPAFVRWLYWDAGEEAWTQSHLPRQSSTTFFGGAEKVDFEHSVWTRFFSTQFPRLHGRFIRAGLLPKTPEYDEMRRYLVGFENRMLALNGQRLSNSEGIDIPGDNRFVRPEGVMPLREAPVISLHFPDYAPLPEDHQQIHQIRQHVRMLTDLARGAEEVTAPVAAVDRNSRMVRNVVRVLEKTSYPLVLLGEPGGGKSTVMREVAMRLAHNSLSLGTPRLPVYVALGSYRSIGPDGQPGDVLSLVKQSIPKQFPNLRSKLEWFVEQGRLAVFFDGMDEMDRGLYTERVRRLSQFALDYRFQIKTLFACRVANFSPAFEHRQVILLPFSESKIREYIRKNFEPHTILKTNVKGVEKEESYSHKQIANRLLSSPALRGTAQIPLTLFLLRHYLRKEQAWPERRHQLYRKYIEFLYTRLTRSLTELNLQDLPAPADVIEGWEKLAHLVMKKNQGTSLTRAEFDELAASMGKPDLISWSERGGLLRPDLSDQPVNTNEHVGGTLRFSHHQIQEYLSAKFLVNNSPQEVLDWASLIDSPRWQETLIHAASINPGTLPVLAVLEATFTEVVAAYEALEKEIAEAEVEKKDSEQQLEAIKPDYYDSYGQGGSVPRYGPEKTAQRKQLQEAIEAKQKLLKELPFRLRSSTERVWSDRVVFTSQLLKEAGGTAESLRSSLVKLYTDAVKHLSTRGRPPSQVKMLWAFRNAPDVCTKEYLATPFHSTIGWVRDQAISVVSNLGGRASSWIDEEILFDLSQGRLFSRLPAYIKGSSASLSKSITLLWATCCYLFFELGYLVAAFGFIFLTMFLTDGIPSRLWGLPEWNTIGEPWSSSVTVFGMIIILVLASMVVPGWRFSLRAAVVALFAACMIIIAHGIGFSARLPHSFTMLAAVPAGIALAGAAAMRLLSYGIFWVYAIPRSLPSRWRELSANVTKTNKFRDTIPEVCCFIFGVIALAVAAISVIYQYAMVPLFEWLGSIAWLIWVGNIFQKLVVIMSMGASLLFIGWLVFAWIREYGLWSVAKTIALVCGLLCIVGAGIAGVFYSVVYLINTHAGKTTVRMIGLALAGCIICLGFLWWLTSALAILRFRWMSIFLGRGSRVPKSIDPSAWRKMFVASSALNQANILNQTSHISVGLSVRGFLELLESCEIDVKRDPAATIYWRKRHEIEEILKQEKSGSH